MEVPNKVSLECLSESLEFTTISAIYESARISLSKKLWYFTLLDI
jgi:hypothetical protein